MPLTIIMIVFVTYVQNLIRLTQSNIAYLSAYKRDKHIGTSPILKQRKYLQKEYEKLYGIKDYDVQFDIVAHSMGGLLSR